MKIWARIWKDNRMLRDTVAEDLTGDTRTHKIFRLLEAVAMEFDLPKPIWLDANVSEFRKTSKTRFRSDSFIEEIPFDYLEFQILEED